MKNRDIFVGIYIGGEQYFHACIVGCSLGSTFGRTRGMISYQNATPGV
jgi:hypothetical protein